MSEIGALVLIAALVLAATAAWWLRTRDGAIRPGPVADRAADVPADGPSAARDAPVRPAEVDPRLPVLTALGVRPEQADLTVVQFSTAFCAPCRATKARLEQLRAERPRLAVVHVDAEAHLEAVRALDVRRTPTLFYLDRAGAVIGRSSGAPRPAELTALVDAHAAPAPAAAPRVPRDVPR